MVFEKTIWVSAEDAETCNEYLNEEPQDADECLGEDETLSYSVKFDNGVEATVKVCGVQYEEGEDETNTAWSEMVLCRDGEQLAYTEPGEDFVGDWSLVYGNDTYVVIVRVKPEPQDVDSFMGYLQANYSVEDWYLVRNILDSAVIRMLPREQRIDALLELLDGIGLEREELESIQFEPPARNRFVLDVGDYSFDGHHMDYEYVVEANAEDVAELQDAHRRIKKVTGVDIEAVCDETARIEQPLYDKIVQAGYEFPEHYVDPDTGEHYMQDAESAADAPEMMAALWVWLLNQVEPNLDVKLLPDPDYPHLLQCGKNLEPIGYGIFS